MTDTAYSELDILPDQPRGVPRIPGLRFVRRLGHGGMGSVFLAHDEELGRQVAVKLLSPRSLGTASRRFRREFHAMSRLDHPGVVKVIRYDVAGPFEYFVMEYVEGESLRRFLLPREAAAARRRLQEPDYTTRVARLMVQVADALGYLHGHLLLHRDLKPANIMVQPDRRVKLVDFGTAKAMAASAGSVITEEGQTLGTARYMSPEQIRGRRLDGRADLYSFGVVLYEVLAARPPFHDESVYELMRLHVSEVAPPLSIFNPSCPPELLRLVDRLLSKRPDDRPSSAHEVSRVLRQLATPIASGSFYATPSRLEFPDADLSIPAPPELDDDLPSAAGPEPRVFAPRFSGRLSEVSCLLEYYRAGIGGQSRAILVRGESGIGKTRLLEEVADILRFEEGALVLRGHIARDEEVAYGPFAPILAGLARWLRRQPSDFLVREVGPAGAVLAELHPDFTRPIERSGLPTPVALDSSGQRLRRMAALGSLLAAVARRTPVAIFVDDLQWDAGDGLELFHNFARLLSHLGSDEGGFSLLVGAIRAEEEDHSPHLRGILDQLRAEGLIEEMPLHALDAESAATLVQTMLAVNTGGEQLIEQIHPDVYQSPLYLQEVIHQLADENGDAWVEGRWRMGPLTAALARDGARALPPSLKETVARRVSSLPHDHQRALLAMAVIGPSFAFSLLHRVLEEPVEAVADLLDDFIRQGFVVPRSGDEESYAFAHEKFREAVLRIFTRQRAQAWHQRVAAVLAQPIDPTRAEAVDETWDEDLDLSDDLEEIGEDGEPEVDPGLLAFHLARAGQPLEALPHLSEAAERARDQGRFHEALGHLDRAVELAGDDPERVFPLLVSRLSILGPLTRWDRATRDLDWLERLAQQRDDPSWTMQVLTHRAQFLMQSQRLAAAKLVAQRVLGLLGRDPTGSVPGLLALNILASVDMVQGRLEAAAGHWKRVMLRSEEQGLTAWRCRAMSNLGSVYLHLGQYQQARDLIDNSIELMQELGWNHGIRMAQANRVILDGAESGCTEGVLAEHRRLAEAARESGDRRLLGVLLASHGQILVRADQPGALPLLQEALRELSEAGQPFSLVQAIPSLARALLTANDPESAGRRLDQGEQLLSEMPGVRLQVQELHFARFLQAQALGDEDAADLALDAAWDMVQRQLRTIRSAESRNSFLAFGDNPDILKARAQR